MTKSRDDAEAVPMGYGPEAETAPALEDLGMTLGGIENKIGVVAGEIEEQELEAGRMGFPMGEAEDSAAKINARNRRFWRR